MWYNLSCESRKDLIVAWAYSLLRMVVPAYTIKRSLAAVPSHTIAAPVREVSVMSNPKLAVFNSAITVCPLSIN